jgi:hypothetical protein
MSVVICEVNKTDTILELQSKHEVNVPTVTKKEETITLQGIDPAVIGGFDDYFGQYSRTDIETGNSTISPSYGDGLLNATNDSSQSFFTDILRRLERGGL